MTLDFKQLVKDYNLNIKGIIQLGTHEWQEKETFVDLGVKNFVLVEPQKHVFSITEKKALELKSQGKAEEINLFNCAVSSFEGQIEMICDSTNQGQSSSLLKPKEHLKNCPWVKFTKTEMVQVRELDKLDFNRDNYKGIVADLQGNEYSAFIGGINTIKRMDFIYCEVNFVEMYEGCRLVGDLDKLLDVFNFKRVVTSKDQGGWGDGLYVKCK